MPRPKGSPNRERPSLASQVASLTKQIADAREVIRRREETIDADRKTLVEKNYLIETLGQQLALATKNYEEAKADYFARNRQYDHVCRQNLTLRVALKEVL